MNYKDDIKAIMFDYDGTLINFEYKASKYTVEALKRLKDSKYKICLSSGRPPYVALKCFISEFGDYPLDYVFGSNGSEFLDVKNNKYEMLKSLDVDMIKEIISKVSKDYIYVCCYKDNDILVDKRIEDEELISFLKARQLNIVEFDYSSNKSKRSKIVCLTKKQDRLKEEEFIKTIDLKNYELSYSTPNSLEIMPKGVSKKDSVDKLCSLLNCNPKQILAFGDMPNDMPMLEYASGVIMDNASDDLKAKIALHTDSVDNKGIYDFLSKNQLI